VIGRAVLGLVPAWAWTLALGAGVTAAGAWHLVRVADARDAGRAEVQAQWDDVERRRGDQIRADRERRAWAAIEQSKAHRATQAALAQSLMEARHALQNALSAPISCPREGNLRLGDLVLPGAVLDGVRRAAGAAAGQRAD
jgi:hypothetical protein